MRELPSLERFTQLRVLNASYCTFHDGLGPLPTGALTHLSLSYCSGRLDLSWLAQLSRLRQLAVKGCLGAEGLFLLPSSLCSLTLVEEPTASALAPCTLEPLRFLRELHLQGRPSGGNTLEPLAQLSALRSLALVQFGGVGDLAPLAALTALTELQLESFPDLASLAGIHGLPELRFLSLRSCPGLTGGPALAALQEFRDRGVQVSA